MGDEGQGRQGGIGCKAVGLAVRRQTGCGSVEWLWVVKLVVGWWGCGIR